MTAPDASGSSVTNMAFQAGTQVSLSLGGSSRAWLLAAEISRRFYERRAAGPRARKLCSNPIATSTYPALYDRNVAVDGQVSEALDCAARQRPLDFQPIHFCSLSKSQDNPGIVVREVTSPCHFHTSPLNIASLPGDYCSDGVAVRFTTIQIDPQPLILGSHFIFQ